MFKRIKYNSPVILTFVFASLIALILNWLSGGMANRLFFSVYSLGPYFEPLMIVRMFGYVLGHASLEHYLSNMTILLLIGPMLEEKYGSKRILTLMMMTALITAFIQMLFFKGAILGASGIAFALIMLSSIVHCTSDEIPLTFLMVAVVYLGTQILNGLFAVDNVSQMGHLIGGIVGSVYGFTAGKNR